MALALNAGGLLSPAEVIGRDMLIDSLWKIMESRQSIRLNAERRKGKTSIIKKMTAEAPNTVVAIYRDLEAVHSPAEFLAFVMQDIREWLTEKQRVQTWVKDAWKKIGGTEVAGILKLPPAQAGEWKS